MDGPHALALNERLLELLADAGLNPVAAAQAAYLLIVYVFGSVALEVADLHPGPPPPDSERIATRHLTFAATSADRYPRAAAAAATLAGYIATPQYRWGLQRVLDGITTHAATDPKTPVPSAAQDNARPEQLDRL